MVEKKHRILIVDDEESIRFTLECFLTEEGYEVVTAKNYDEPTEMIETIEMHVPMDVLMKMKCQTPCQKLI